MAHDNLRFAFFWGGEGRGESRGRTDSGPTPSILEALVCGEARGCLLASSPLLHIINNYFF